MGTTEWKRLGHRGKGVAQPRPINYAAGGRLGRITLSRDAARQREARASCHPLARFTGRDLHKWRAYFLGRNEYPRREVKEYSFSFFFALSLQDALQTYAARLARDIPWDVMRWSR